MSACRQCGKPVPVYTKDYAYRSPATGELNGEVIKRAGRFSGSAWMYAFDPKHYFCTMRCAARYGIAAASKRGSR